MSKGSGIEVEKQSADVWVLIVIGIGLLVFNIGFAMKLFSTDKVVSDLIGNVEKEIHQLTEKKPINTEGAFSKVEKAAVDAKKAPVSKVEKAAVDVKKVPVSKVEKAAVDAKKAPVSKVEKAAVDAKK
jgi:hypothetical protein